MAEAVSLKREERVAAMIILESENTLVFCFMETEYINRDGKTGETEWPIMLSDYAFLCRFAAENIICY